MRLALADMRSRSLSVLPDGDGGTANSTRRAGLRSGVDLHQHVNQTDIRATWTVALCTLQAAGKDWRNARSW